MTFAKSLGSAVSEAASEVDFAKSEPVFGRKNLIPKDIIFATLAQWDDMIILKLAYLSIWTVFW